MLVCAGEPARDVYVLHRGQVRTYVLGGDGRETTTAILGAGQLVGISPLLGQPAYDEFAEALGPGVVQAAPADRLLRALSEDRELLRFVVGALAERLAQSVTLLADVALATVSQRAASVEQLLFDQLGEPPKLNKRRFSDLIGARPETLSRVSHGARPPAVSAASGPAASPGRAPRASAPPPAASAARIPLDLSAALARLPCHHYAQGERFAFDTPAGVYLIKNGWVRLLVEDARGRRVVVDDIESGWFGLPSLAVSLGSRLQAEAMSTVSAWRLAPTQLLRVLDECPSAGCRIVSQTAERLLRVEQLLHRAHAPNARARVASLLIDVVRRQGAPNPDGGAAPCGATGPTRSWRTLSARDARR